MAMNDMIVVLALVGLLALLAGLFAVLAWRAAAGAPARLSLTLDKLLAGGRAEAETTRAILAAAEGRLNTAIQAGTTDALSKAFAQITGATQDMAHAVEALRRAASEDSQKVILLLESRLAAIQNSVNEKLHEAVEQQMTTSFARVLEQFAQVQLAMGEVQSAAAQVGDLKRIFSNVSTRGGWGEAQLGAMLEQVLPPGSFERNFVLREATRERVDFALRMPSREKLWLAVDSKFPTEDYARLLDAAAAADFEGERKAREGLAARIRLEARKIREKYICPPDTVDFGVMYLPSDGLFAEVARMPNLIDEIRTREKVMILGPSLLPAMLQTIHLGHITLDLDQRAGEISRMLGATRAEMIRMDEALLKLANSATTMSNNIENVRKRNRVMKKVLEKVELVEGGGGQVLLGLSAEEEE
jgi:DNA recombination protein RmuC